MRVNAVIKTSTSFSIISQSSIALNVAAIDWYISWHTDEYKFISFCCTHWLRNAAIRASGYRITGENMNAQDWFNDKKNIKKSEKKYAHFDVRTDIQKAQRYISDPEKVAKHGFYPMIHYKKDMSRYSGKTHKIKNKERDICYSAHIDRCIFQYYSAILNESYNSLIKKMGIGDVPVAYRTDLHKSNVQCAVEAINFIRKTESGYVLIGDFTHFFDNLKHDYLREQLLTLLGTDKLPADQEAVFHNITRYSLFERDDLLDINDLPHTRAGIKKLNARKRVLSTQEFKRYKYKIKRNDKDYGIPQGSPISACYANIYMLTADKKIADRVKESYGRYMRYSDDFIIVLPESSEAKDLIKYVVDCLFKDGSPEKIPGVTLEPEKTQIFHFDRNGLRNVGKNFLTDADTSHNAVNFLGFQYDGKEVTVRAKTISKYYYRMHRKAIGIAHQKIKNGYDCFKGADKLYAKYSERGKRGLRGNFFTYMDRAEREFPDDPISRDTSRHMIRIRKTLKKHSKTLDTDANG